MVNNELEIPIRESWITVKFTKLSTNRKKNYRLKKPCDIISHSSQGIAGDIYVPRFPIYFRN